MSMGSSGSGASTQTVTQKNEIPKYESDFAQENIDLSRDLADRTYPTYTGQRNADLTTDTKGGIASTEKAASDPYYADTSKKAIDTTTGYLDKSYLNDYGALTKDYLGGTYSPSSVSEWMNPYVESALQPEIRDIQRTGANTEKDINAKATGAGAFGDSAHGIRLSENDRNTNQLVDDATAKGYSKAYDSALGASLDASKQNEDIGYKTWTGNATQYNKDRDASLTASTDLSKQVSDLYGLTETQASDLLTVGDLQQKQDQKGLDTAYTDFLNEFEYPEEGLNLRLATGSKTPYSTTRLTTSPYSSSSQTIGGVASLFGLSGKYGSSSTSY